MTILKIGKYIINEKYITYIDLDCDMYVDNNLVNGVCIWFNFEYHIYNESHDKYVNVPHCLKLLIKEDINAIRYYYKSKRKPLAIDLNVLYEIEKTEQKLMKSYYEIEKAGQELKNSYINKQEIPEKKLKEIPEKNLKKIPEKKLKEVYIDEEKSQIFYSNL